MDDEGGGHAPPHPPLPSGMQSCPKFPEHAACLLEQLNMQRHYSNSGGAGQGLGVGEFCDVTVRVEGCDFRLHRCILAAVSSKLQAMMYSTMAGQQEDCVLSLKDMTVTGFRVVMDYVYSGILRLDSMHVHQVFAAAQCLGLHDIQRACRDFLREVHMDLQPRNSATFDTMGMFRPNSQMMNMQYSGVHIDPNLQQGFPTEMPGHQGIPQDQQSIPPEADDMCPESQGNPTGIPQTLHTNNPRMQNEMHANKTLDPKLLQNSTLVNQTVLTDQGRLLSDQTFNLNPGFSSQAPPPPQLLHHQSQNTGYPQTNEQLLPLNLHRVPNNQLMLGPNKNMELSNPGVLSNQTLSADPQLLASQGFDNNSGSLMLTNDQYGSANLLGSNTLPQEGNAQMLGTGNGDMMSGPLTPIHHHNHHQQQHMQQQQQQPLTPASTHQTEPPHTPTPTPPLQQHGFPNMPMPQNCIEDYLKLFESLQGDQQHNGHMSNQADTLQMDQMCSNVYTNKQEYSQQMGANLMGGMDMEQNLIPPPLPQGSMPQMMPTYTSTNYIPPSLPAVSRPMDPLPPPPMLPLPPISSSTPTLPTRTSPQGNVTTSSTFEDVRKTVLNVLIQERFDEDEDSLVKSLGEETATKTIPKESVPLTSLLNIATVNQKQYQDINLDSTGFQMGRMLGTDGEELQTETGKGAIETDSDNEGNLVIAEQDFEEQVVYEACNIANSSNSDVQIDLENPVMNDPVNKWPSTEESPTNQQQRLNLSEIKDDCRNCSNTDVQMENNSVKPLKKRLRRLKLKVNGENDESEVNTPIESDTLALPELASQEQEPFSRKKHLLDMSKNLDNSQGLTTPTDTNLQMLEQQRNGNYPVIHVYPKDMNLMMPNNNTSALEQKEDMYQIQSKKQKASSKQQEDKEKDATKTQSSDSKQTPTMKPAHRKLLGSEKQKESSSPEEHDQEDPMDDESNLESHLDLPATLENMETDEAGDDEPSSPAELLPPSLEVADIMPEPSSQRSESPPKLVKAKVTVVKNGKKHIKQSTKHNVNPTDKKTESPKVPKSKAVEFKCNLCGRNFPKANRLQFHLTQHKKNELYPCKECGQEFGRLGELTRHERQHSEIIYKCRTCSAQFQSPNLYRAHCIKVHDEKRMFYCTFPNCDFDAKQISLVEQHKLVHSESKAYHCENCGQSFRQPNGLTGHKKSCQKQETHECKICHKKFNYRHGLKQHVLTHTGVRPNECSICFIRVRDPRNLKRHMRIHEGLYPYECPHCPKKYRFSNTLKKHMLQHSTDSESGAKAKTRSQKNPKAARNQCADAIVVTEDRENSTEQPRLWDVTAVTVKNVDESGEEVMKVKLEASLVTDSGYV